MLSINATPSKRMLKRGSMQLIRKLKQPERRLKRSQPERMLPSRRPLKSAMLRRMPPLKKP